MNEGQKKGLAIAGAVVAVLIAVFMATRFMGDPPLEKGQTNLNTGPRLSDIEKRGTPLEGKTIPGVGGEPDSSGAVGNR